MPKEKIKEEIQKLENISSILAITSEELISKVEILVQKEGFRYAEAIVHIAKELNLEAEDLINIIPKPLKEKMYGESQRLNVILRSTRQLQFK
jgi:energy-converting hydrogenase A subunit M